jgi:hypothetical protein
MQSIVHTITHLEYLKNFSWIVWKIQNETWFIIKFYDVIHADGARICLWTAASNGPIVHTADDTVPFFPPQIPHGLTRSEPGLRGGRPATNRLSYVTAKFHDTKWTFIDI